MLNHYANVSATSWLRSSSAHMIQANSIRTESKRFSYDALKKSLNEKCSNSAQEIAYGTVSKMENQHNVQPYNLMKLSCYFFLPVFLLALSFLVYRGSVFCRFFALLLCI